MKAAITATRGDADLHSDPPLVPEGHARLEDAFVEALGAEELRAADIDLLVRVASRQLSSGQFAAAERVMERVLSQYTENASFHHLMSVIQERLGKTGAAIMHAEASIRIEPDDYNRLSRLGTMLLSTDRPADAEAAFRHATTLKPEVIEYHRLLVTSLEQQNRYDAALEALEAAVRSNPTSSVLTTRLQELRIRKATFTEISQLIRAVDPVTLKLLPLNFGHLMFSQFGEDGVLWQLLCTVRNGFYVDIGAHHPVRMSNTALLHHYNGWSGINIDADQRYVDEFNLWRPNDVNICCGVGAEAGNATMAIFADGAVNSFDPAEIEKSQTKGGRQITERRDIQIRTLVDIFSAHLPVGRQIDLLNVDAEGWDMAILGANDWSRYRPKLILVEDHSMTLTKVEGSATYRLLRDQGYQLFSHTLATSFYRQAT